MDLVYEDISGEFDEEFIEPKNLMIILIEKDLENSTNLLIRSLQTSIFYII